MQHVSRNHPNTSPGRLGTVRMRADSCPPITYAMPAAVVDLGTLALLRPISLVERQPTVDGPR